MRYNLPIPHKKDLFMHHQSLTGQWTFRQHNTAEWLPATVGGVHTVCSRRENPDPFVADNEKQVQLDQRYGLEYRTTFNAYELLNKPNNS
jgi:hypothetical protein